MPGLEALFLLKINENIFLFDLLYFNLEIVQSSTSQWNDKLHREFSSLAFAWTTFGLLHLAST